MSLNTAPFHPKDEQYVATVTSEQALKRGGANVLIHAY